MSCSLGIKCVGVVCVRLFAESAIAAVRGAIVTGFFGEAIAAARFDAALLVVWRREIGTSGATFAVLRSTFRNVGGIVFVSAARISMAFVDFVMSPVFGKSVERTTKLVKSFLIPFNGFICDLK